MNVRLSVFFRVFALMAFIGLGSRQVQAGSLLIWPVDPVINSDESATALWLENQGQEPLHMQLRIFAWEQLDGKEQYLPQDSIAGSPPMMEIAPGQRQLVRLIRQKPAPAGKEEAWRLIIDEIPVLLDQDTAGNKKPRAAIGIQMRYSLPLFTYGEGLSPGHAIDDRASQLQWRIVTAADNMPYLEISNQGSHHTRLSNVAFKTSNQQTPVKNGLLGYVLAHSTMRWPLGFTVGDAELHAKIDGTPHAILTRAANRP